MPAFADQPDRLLVEEVRQGDHDDIGVGMVDGGLQVGRGLGMPSGRGTSRPSTRCGSRRPAPGPGHAGRERVGVELADQPGPEHRDGVAVHGVSSISSQDDPRARGRVRRPWPGAWRPSPGGRSGEAAIWDEGQPFGWHARRQHRLRPFGDLVGRLEVGVLDVDDPGRDVATRRGDLAQDLDLGHLAVGELEHELVDVEAEHRVEDRP